MCIDPPIPPPCRAQNARQWCDLWVGRKSVSVFWRRAGRGHKRPFTSTAQPQPRHRCLTLTAQQTVVFRKKNKNEENRMSLAWAVSDVMAICAKNRTKTHWDHNIRQWSCFPKIKYVMFSNVGTLSGYICNLRRVKQRQATLIPRIVINSELTDTVNPSQWHTSGVSSFPWQHKPCRRPRTS